MVLQEEITKLLINGEGPRLEFKTSDFLKDTKKIAITLAEFANREGGVLLVGATDDGEIEGMKFNKKDEERIMQIAKSSCQPSITPEFSFVHFNDGVIYYINILKANERPIKTNDRWYIRHGTTTRTMEYEELLRFNKKPEAILPSAEEERLDIGDILLKENKKNILIQNGKEIPYLESESSKGSAEVTIYAKIFNQYPEKAYYLETHINSITIDELKRIINIYYTIFQYDHYVSAFGINQEKDSWFGYGALNFINALEMQDIRYAESNKNKEYIHHREAACFIDELSNSIFYIHLQPNRKSKQDDLVTIDYVNIGFVFRNIPYNNKYSEFFQKIGSIPEFINEKNTPLTKFKKLKYIFKEEGYIIDNPTNLLGGWVSGIFTENFENNNITDIYNDKIIVNFRRQHEMNDKCSYRLLGVAATTLPAENFPARVVNYIGDWNIIE